METKGNKGIFGKWWALGLLLAWALIACAGGGTAVPLAGGADPRAVTPPPEVSGRWQLVEFFAIA